MTSTIAGSVGQRFLSVLTAGGLLVLAPHAAVAAVHRYVDWTSVDPGKGKAGGRITLPDSSHVTVRFAARNPDGSQGPLFGAQVDEGGTNYWLPSAPYISAEVENAPAGTDIVQLAGGDDQVYELTFSEPVKDPVLAIVSLGAPGIVSTYHFGAPFTITSQGAGALGGSDQALTRLPGNVLEGTDGHGTIRFTGTFTTLAWTVPTPEVWHGFTLGIRTAERLEPGPSIVPDAGAGSDAADTGNDATVGPSEVEPTGTGGARGAGGSGGAASAGSSDAATTAPVNESGGCRFAGGPGGGTWWLAAAALAGARFSRRRRR